MTRSLLVAFGTFVVSAAIATSSSAMTFGDYDGSAGVLGDRADVSELFSGRLTAKEARRTKHAEALKDLRENRKIAPVVTDELPNIEAQRPLSLTLPFLPKSPLEFPNLGENL